MKNFFHFAVGFGLSLLSFSTEARLLKIIHTNDLHSYFTGYLDGRGGYARVKTKIDELKKEAGMQGISVLHLDGGDFGEGTSFFFSEEGVASVRTIGMLGTDVSVIGNHDHMMGGKTLGHQIRTAHIKTKFISSNIVQTPEMELADVVKPYVDFTKGGIKIRVIGLSTPEAHFQYPLKPGFILPANPVGVLQSNLARKEGKELVIALTHLGKSADEKLAKGSKEIDVIVGGHSHTRLDKVVYVKNKKGRQVPIVQAASHGLVVGELLIDLQDDGKIKVVKYKLHDIKDPIVQDPGMKMFVERAYGDRNEYFGGRWNDIIGYSSIPLTGYVDGNAVQKSSCWGRHMAKLTRKSSDTHIGIHLASFEGVYKEPGPVTFGDMIDNFPHIRNYGDNGWQISKINMKGLIFKNLIRAFINIKDVAGINFDGVTYNSIILPKFIPFIGGKIWAFNIKVNGAKVNYEASYSMSFPTEVGHALRTSLPAVTQAIFPSLEDTGIYYWDVMEDYIKKNSPLKCL